MRRGNFELAAADYSEAIRLDPNGASHYYDRGVVYEAMGQLDRAKMDFAKAVELAPKWRKPREKLAQYGTSQS